FDKVNAAAAGLSAHCAADVLNRDVAAHGFQDSRSAHGADLYLPRPAGATKAAAHRTHPNIAAAKAGNIGTVSRLITILAGTTTTSTTSSTPTPDPSPTPSTSTTSSSTPSI